MHTSTPTVHSYEGDEVTRNTDADGQAACTMFMAHKIDSVTPFFKAHEIPYSGTKEQMEERLQNALAERRIKAADVIAALNEVEGWGNQHVYLYRVPLEICDEWRTEDGAREKLEIIGQAHLLNNSRPLLLPETPTLATIEWHEERVRFVWVEKREWKIRREELDNSTEDIFFKAYEQKISRGVTSFDWDLTTGNAELLIQRLPSGEQYGQIRESFLSFLDDVIDSRSLTPISVKKAIKRLETSTEVSKRQLEHATQQGGTARFTSRSRQSDAFDDESLKNARNALGPTASVMGNFYWKEKSPQLSRRVHVNLYATDNRVGIFGEFNQQEIKYVLSRIRHHCR